MRIPLPRWHAAVPLALVILVLVGVLLVAGPGAGADEPPESAAAFPASWEGTWTGSARMIRQTKTAMTFPMALEIKPIEEGRWTWTVIYGEGASRQVRPYELVVVDPETGHYRIDEKNSIVLDAFHENETLHSRFWVGDQVIEAQYRMDGTGLSVELTTYGAKPLTMTGGGEGRVPPVGSYGLRSVQRAALTRAAPATGEAEKPAEDD